MALRACAENHNLLFSSRARLAWVAKKNKVLLEICINFASYETFLLENDVSLYKMYWPDITQIVTKMRDLMGLGGMGTISA